MLQLAAHARVCVYTTVQVTIAACGVVCWLPRCF